MGGHPHRQRHRGDIEQQAQRRSVPSRQPKPHRQRLEGGEQRPGGRTKQKGAADRKSVGYRKAGGHVWHPERRPSGQQRETRQDQPDASDRVHEEVAERQQQHRRTDDNNHPRISGA